MFVIGLRGKMIALDKNDCDSFSTQVLQSPSPLPMEGTLDCILQ